MRRLMPVVAAVAVIVALSSSTDTLAGLHPDPNLNDTVYGTVAGIRYASDSHAFDPTYGYANATAGCGSINKRLIGGGAVANGIGAHSWLEFTRPDDSVDADIETDDGFFGSGYGSPTKALRTFAICIEPIQLDYRDLPVAAQSSERDATLKCEGSGWHVVSGSAGIASTASSLTSSFPIDDADPGTTRDDGWRATAHDTANGNGIYRIYAVCAKGVTRHYVKSGPSTQAAHSSPTVKVSCGTDHVVGGGAKVSGDPDTARLVMSAPYDGPDADEIPDDGWRTRVYNAGPGSKQVTSFAICLET